MKEDVEKACKAYYVYSYKYMFYFIASSKRFI